MSVGRIAVLALTAMATLVGVAGSAQAQSPEPPPDVSVRIGPLLASPAIRLSSIGHDSNVFNRNDNDNPVGDDTATLSPTLETWLRLARLRVYGRGELDYYYFKDLSNIRALDSDGLARLDLLLNRLTLYVEGRVENTKHRQNLEIDAIARRRTDSTTAGADVRLTSKISVGAYSRQSRLKYDANSLYLGTDLGQVLNHTSAAEAVGVRYAATTLTTFAVDIEQQRDRFAFTGERDADSVRVTPGVEFSPFALVTGRASIGFQRRRFLGGNQSDFNGTTALVDLNYTLLGRTRFSVRANRALQYSYLIGQPDYVEAGLTGSVTQHLGDSWDVGGNLGRARLTYDKTSVPTGFIAAPDETVLTAGADLGYTIGRTRVGFQVEHRKRDAQDVGRGYQRFRVGASVTHVF